MAKRRKRQSIEPKQRMNTPEFDREIQQQEMPLTPQQRVDGNGEWEVSAQQSSRRAPSGLRGATALVADEGDWDAFDFQNGYGVTQARRHRNPDGSLGGWVEEGAVVAPTVTLGPDAWVYEKATIWDNAQIDGRAQVRGSSLVYGDAIISGNAIVDDEANVYGSARIMDSAHLKGRCAVFGNATVGGNAIIGGQVYILNKAHVTDNVRIAGRCTIRGSSYLKGNIRLAGELDLKGNIQMGGNFELRGKCVFVGSHIIVSKPHTSTMEHGIYGYSGNYESAKMVADRLFNI
jgi:carbonic anhydrase/acetyltransferase-like protein (isoleucine patch superfamily)